MSDPFLYSLVGLNKFLNLCFHVEVVLNNNIVNEIFHSHNYQRSKGFFHFKMLHFV